MLDRAACERRVYRLAALLTGNPIAATRVISQVIDSQPDLSTLDSAHMDRLTVLRSREVRPAALASDLIPRAAADRLAALTAQQREAYIFARVYQTPMREMARAMDCSIAAAQRHLDHADATMAQSMPEAEHPLRGGEKSSAESAQQFQQAVSPAASDVPSMLRAYSMSLDVPDFYRAQRTRHKRLRWVGIVAAIALAAIILAALFMWWTRPLSGDAAPSSSRPAETSLP